MNEAVNYNSNVNGLATAALILGIVGALGFVFVFPPFICGSTAIVLGLLSRATEDSMSLRAKIGICMGALSMVLLCIILVSAVHFIINNPDIFNNVYNSFDEMYNDMYQEILRQEGGFV